MNKSENTGFKDIRPQLSKEKIEIVVANVSYALPSIEMVDPKDFLEKLSSSNVTSVYAHRSRYSTSSRAEIEVTMGDVLKELEFLKVLRTPEMSMVLSDYLRELSMRLNKVDFSIPGSEHIFAHIDGILYAYENYPNRELSKLFKEYDSNLSVKSVLKAIAKSHDSVFADVLRAYAEKEQEIIRLNKRMEFDLSNGLLPLEIETSGTLVTLVIDGRYDHLYVECIYERYSSRTGKVIEAEIMLTSSPTSPTAKELGFDGPNKDDMRDDAILERKMTDFSEGLEKVEITDLSVTSSEEE